MKKRMSVNEKAIAGIIAFTLFFAVFTCLAGFLIFDHVIEKLYNDKGYVVANIISHDIDHDKISEYTKTWEADDYYHEMEDYLHHVEEYSGAAYIYIAVPYEDHTMRYVYDSDSFIGDSDPISASFEEIWNAYTKGIRPTSYLVRKSKKYGYLTSSCLPIADSSGNIVALLFVDTHMEEILSTLGRFIFYMVVISLVLMLVFCILNWMVLNKNFIKPIMFIKKNLDSFAESSATVDDSLSSIQTGDEIEDLAISVHDMENDLVKYIDSIKTITAEKERISAELSVATQIQADMLPRVFPPFPERKNFDIYATMVPAKEVGGDFYDFFLIDDDHIALVMADVSGKGVPAALFMVNAKTLIKNRTMTSNNLSTSEIIHDVNNMLCEGNDAEMFVTVWLCIIQLSTGNCRITNAGHEHPAVKVSRQDYSLKTYRHSIAVAAMPDVKFEEHEFKLDPGDSLFVYTDGVTEATDADNTLFGTDRLIASLNKEKDADATALLGLVKEDIDAFVGNAPQFDDITMLCFRYLGK